MLWTSLPSSRILSSSATWYSPFRPLASFVNSSPFLSQIPVGAHPSYTIINTSPVLFHRKPTHSPNPSTFSQRRNMFKHQPRQHRVKIGHWPPLRDDFPLAVNVSIFDISHLKASVPTNFLRVKSRNSSLSFAKPPIKFDSGFLCAIVSLVLR